MYNGIVYCEIVPIAEFSIILTLIAENSSSTLRDLTKSPFLKNFCGPLLKVQLKFAVQSNQLLFKIFLFTTHY